MSESMPTPVAPARVWPLYRAMVGIGLACGLLIVGVFQWTLPVIQRNRAEALQREILRVLPQATTSRSFLASEDGSFEAAPEGAKARVHAGYDASGRLVGFAVEAEGMGYQDLIHLIWGYSFSQQAIIGIGVLESRETPGLGDRIETDPEFLANFEALDVSLAGNGQSLMHPIESVKRGEKQHPWQVDAITGATISSVAVADILRRSASHWVPRLRTRLDDFRGEG